MKKWLLISLCFLFVMGCGNIEKQNTVDEKENVIEEQETEEKETQEDHVAKTEEGEDQLEQEDTPVQDTESQEMEPQEPQYKINEVYYVKPIADADKKVVLLTFDDAPDKYALDIANTLKELEVGAIFFVNGHFLDSDEEKETLKKIHDMGFLIGNHTMTHADLKKSSEEKQREEIVKLNDRVEEIIGERPKFFRAPYGNNTDFAKNLAVEEKMVQMKWSYGFDYFPEYMEKEALTKATLEHASSGVNFLMHDRKWTLEALPDIVKGLQDKGYKIVDPHLIETIQ